MILIIEAAQTPLAPYAEGVQCGGDDVPSGEAPAYAGTDFIIWMDGRIAAV